MAYKIKITLNLLAMFFFTSAFISGMAVSIIPDLIQYKVQCAEDDRLINIVVHASLEELSNIQI